MRRTTIALGMVVAMLAIAGAVFGGLAAASTQKASANSPVTFAVKGAASQGTIDQFMTALQKRVPDPQAFTPAQIKSAAKAVGKQFGYPASKVKITVSCSYPPFSCTITVQF